MARRWFRVCVDIDQEGGEVVGRSVEWHLDEEVDRIDVRAADPFLTATEQVTEMIDSLPVQLRML